MSDQDSEMDHLLRRSMAAPVPRLPANFEQTLTREVRRRSGRAEKYAGALYVAYGVVSAAVSMVVMRGQGLGWGAVAVATLGPIAAVAAARVGSRMLSKSV